MWVVFSDIDLYSYLNYSTEYMVLFCFDVLMVLVIDELRMAVKEVICDNKSERVQYEEALIAITVEQSLKR